MLPATPHFTDEKAEALSEVEGPRTADVGLKEAARLVSRSPEKLQPHKASAAPEDRARGREGRRGYDSHLGHRGAVIPAEHPGTVLGCSLLLAAPPSLPRHSKD